MLFTNKLGRGSRVYLFYMSRQHIIILLAITVDLMIQWQNQCFIHVLTAENPS